MHQTKTLINYYISLILPFILAGIFTAWLTTVPNSLDWIYRCAPGVNLCTTILYGVFFSAAWIILAVFIGFILAVIKKIRVIITKWHENLSNWLRQPRIVHRFE